MTDKKVIELIKLLKTEKSRLPKMTYHNKKTKKLIILNYKNYSIH